MAKYVLFGSYCENVVERRAPYREAHLAGLNQQKESGVLITLGPTQDLTQVFGIYDAPDEATVRQLIESDPYWQNGIWTAYEVKEWIQAIG
ncbi:YciI family protein [Alkalinema sp. FACHB-956]|uniref:YciI family protein n=1 Tax=Alkalinema sp. FACHB-956 TaxID=2692768 RepID=UPI00168430F2|nr:YciI family protein [Alkalinema sp. FACHB-956]MBD2327350.1 YciI family protein [Alkalinema sp. FACHB-956]